MKQLPQLGLYRYIWKDSSMCFYFLSRSLSDYLKECRKCTLLRFSFSGLWDAMWENSLKMSRYVASPDEAKQNKTVKMTVVSLQALHLKPDWSQSDLFWAIKTSFRTFYKPEQESRGGLGKEKSLMNGGTKTGRGTMKPPSLDSTNSGPLLLLSPW